MGASVLADVDADAIGVAGFEPPVVRITTMTTTMVIPVTIDPNNPSGPASE